jgi:transcriptional regulator with XRE-family HTH domain/DNA-directed RNA polymerase subunit RPC12/RpoP
MQQVKIGKFIAECRKKENLTQTQLAEKLNITDKAVSKWETGKSMPDSSIMLKLCEILKISVNDLLCGEVVTMDNYNEKSEKALLEMVKQKEQADKRLLCMEIVIGIVGILPLLISTIIVLIIPMKESLATVIILSSLIPLLIATPFALKIEQSAGYYVCSKCNHSYVPTYKPVFFAMHMGRTRYMKCPKCGKRSWQKKSVSKK